ncbi:TPA: hypothetical protein SMF87_004561 [Serratia marcescens]|nr:hypothetical protein [Serratia marcescens]
MSKLKIVKFGDERGVGAIVEVTSLFGIVKRTWTLSPSPMSKELDKWVCRETGRWEFRDCCYVCRFYTAQFNTRANA